MPWADVQLNNDQKTAMPSIAFGTWKIGNGEGPINQIVQALSVGFRHIDTAQMYNNETEVGLAIKKSGLARDKVFVTTKYSSDTLDIPTSIGNSLKNLDMKYVDLYLIHAPDLLLIKNDLPGAWKQMEELVDKGLAKNIGVSNFDVGDLQKVLASAKILPAVNQICLGSRYYVMHEPVIELAKKHGIITEGFSTLSAITDPALKKSKIPLDKIANELKVQTDQVIMAWVKAKGAAVVTTSSNKTRLEGYLAAGDLQLSPVDIAAIDEVCKNSWND